MTILTSVEKPSLAAQAVNAVRSYIRDNDLKVGDALPGEGFFAEQLGVSRPVMREAFGALAALNMVDVANGRRPRVGAIDGSVLAASLDHAVTTAQISVVDVWDVRHTIERRIAGLAAARRSDSQAQDILGLADAMRSSASDLPRMTAYDIAFHQAIAMASGNALFVQMVRSYAVLMETAVPQAWSTRITREQRDMALEQHQRLARAIADRDPAEAIAAMDAHFDTSIADLLAAEVTTAG
ncbi:FadR/GntR family transcriptional regulator [Sphingopyxis fribergensis]